ncbi:hypothetical protein, partial [Xanthomonas oryzae]|uniref:hypothetical protein n=1 Tax=Xanthomonas oryzae TaxID=347 RepID=UPI001C681748
MEIALHGPVRLRHAMGCANLPYGARHRGACRIGAGGSRRVVLEGSNSSAEHRQARSGDTAPAHERARKIQAIGYDCLEPVHDLLSSSARNARWMNCKLVLSLRS